MKLEVKELHLIAMVKAFKAYEALMQPVIVDQPEFKKLAELSNNIMAQILLLNKIIHRKYDGMTNERYLLEVNELLKKGG